MSLFNWKKPNIKAVTLPSATWEAGDTTKTVKKWGDKDQSLAISLNFFEGEPDLPTLSDIDELRQYYRNAISSANRGIIEVELIELHGIQCVRTVFKFPQESSGFTYLTSLTLPFAKCSYVVKIQAPELDLSGMRDNFIMKKLLRDSVISNTPTGYKNWSFDPYKPTHLGKTLMTRAEEAKWDVRFPSHPLTKSRKLIEDVEKHITFDQKLFDLKRFEK